jgi:hypothetical protein
MRARLRTLGPVVGLIPPAVLGLLSLLLTRNSTSAGRGIAGFALGVLAAPGLLVAGVPLSSTSHYAPAIAGSAAFWFLLGLFAAVRATRRPVAGWGDFWRDYAWLAVPVWIGVGAALFVADLALGNALF